MKRLFFALTTIIFFTIIFIPNTYADGVTYFSPDGKKISKEQYEKILAERAEKSAAQKKRQETMTDSQVDIQGNDSYEKTVPRDSLGRPLKTRNGLWITYPGDEGISDSRYNSNSVTTRTKSYRENSDSMLKSIDARKADKYKEQFIKSGKMTDLHKYREALKDYYKD